MARTERWVRPRDAGRSAGQSDLQTGSDRLRGGSLREAEGQWELPASCCLISISSEGEVLLKTQWPGLLLVESEPQALRSRSPGLSTCPALASLVTEPALWLHLILSTNALTLENRQDRGGGTRPGHGCSQGPSSS